MIQVTSPSNIAIVKYWGKHGRQLPRNASLSFTLSKAVSETRMEYKRNQGTGSQVKFYLDGMEKPSFGQKIQLFFTGIADYMPWLSDYDFVFNSHNTFPHSSGIASSASGMSAVAMAISIMEAELKGSYAIDFQKASLLSRLGSGSACRSVFPIMALWGYHPEWPGSSDDYAICIKDAIHPDFHTYHDDILIVSDKEKSVSSTAGHGLMDTNPYASTRYQQAYDNMTALKKILAEGDFHAFGKLAESEALTLHALMMCSDPSFMLMQSGTVEVIHRVRQFRQDTGLPVYFTLDAGPNVHLLYPDAVAQSVGNFIETDLLPLAHGGKILRDFAGHGPVFDQSHFSAQNL